MWLTHRMSIRAGTGGSMLGVAGGEKGGLGGALDGNVAWMTIAALRVGSDPDVGAEAAHPVGDLGGDLLERGSGQCLRMMIVGRAGHPRGAVVEERDAGEAQHGGGAAQF